MGKVIALNELIAFRDTRELSEGSDSAVVKAIDSFIAHAGTMELTDCKDCFYSKDDKRKGCVWCIKHGKSVPANSFCREGISYE